MKFIKLLVVPTAAILLPFKVPDIGIDPDPIINEGGDKQIKISTDRCYGPFDGSENVTVSFSYKEAEANTYTFNIKYYNQETNALLVRESYELKNIVDGENKTFNYTFRLKNKMYPEGIRVEMEFTSVPYLDTNLTFLLYPTINNTIYSYQYRQSEYVVSNRVFAVKDNEVYQDETFKFENTIDYLTNNYDNSFDLSEISFTHNKDIPLIDLTGDKYYVIEDSENIFPKLEKVDGNKIKIPVKLIENENEISMEINKTFLYSIRTFDMKEGNTPGGLYRRTNRIFANQQNMAKLEYTSMYLELNHTANSGTNIIIPLQFIKDRNYIGICSDSNHCIVGGIKE